MVFIHIYGARSIIVLFCDHQVTESESCEIETSISQPIFTHKKISKYLLDNYIHTIQYGRIILWKLFIFMELEPFSYYFVITKTLSWSNEKRKLVYLNKCLPIKTPQVLRDEDIHTL